jgi:superfamily II DNA helicase RecQ
VLKRFRPATAAERAIAAGILNELRPVPYKAAGTLQRALDPAGHMSRGEFDGLLGAMARASLIDIEDAEYERDGEVRRYRKVMATGAGLEFRATPSAELLVADGVVEEFDGPGAAPAGTTRSSAVRKPAKSAEASAPTASSAEDKELTARLREWRSAEAKRLRVPAYVVMHDQTLATIAQVRPRTPRQLLAVKGIGDAKVERFGEAILEICDPGR